MGPELANQIKSDTTTQAFDDFHRNASSIFLKDGEENEVRDIVSNFNNKTSTDCNEVDNT